MSVISPGQSVLFNGWPAIVCEVNGQEIVLYCNGRLIRTTDHKAISPKQTEDVFEHT
jgi:hypothetical protein